MINLKDFFENGLFDVLNCFHTCRFVIRSGLCMRCHGTYDECISWIKKTGYGRHEVISAKLDFLFDTIEIQIR